MDFDLDVLMKGVPSMDEAAEAEAKAAEVKAAKAAKVEAAKTEAKPVEEVEAAKTKAKPVEEVVGAKAVTQDESMASIVYEKWRNGEVKSQDISAQLAVRLAELAFGI